VEQDRRDWSNAKARQSGPGRALPWKVDVEMLAERGVRVEVSAKERKERELPHPDTLGNYAGFWRV